MFSAPTNFGVLILSIATAVAMVLSGSGTSASPQNNQVVTSAFNQVFSEALKPSAARQGVNNYSHPSTLIERKPGVSDEFVQKINDSLSTLSPRLIKALASKGYRITLSTTLTEAVPSVNNQQVRGYTHSATWNSVYGMFNRANKSVVMAELAESPGSGGLVTLKDDSIRYGILRHELGHAIDHCLNHYSHTAEFKKAYSDGLKTISEPERARLNYYLQPGDAGLEETFAELFAAGDRDACDKNSDILLRNHFGTLSKLIKDKVASIHP